MHLRICTGSDQAHLQISKIAKTRRALSPTEVDYSRCRGNLQAYWDNLTSLKFEPGYCWRGIKQCSGHCQFLEVTLAVPIFLIFEPAPLATLQQWDFPTILHALPSRDASVAFHLVGRVLHSGERNHFQVLYAGGSDLANPIYHYDGMINGGYSSFLGHGSLGGTDITLNAISAGFITNSAVYRLQGGPEAQDRFYSHQTASCSRLGVSISPRIGRDIRPEICYEGPAFTPLPNEERFWLKYPSQDCSTADYVAV